MVKILVFFFLLTILSGAIREECGSAGEERLSAWAEKSRLCCGVPLGSSKKWKIIETRKMCVGFVTTGKGIVGWEDVFWPHIAKVQGRSLTPASLLIRNYNNLQFWEKKISKKNNIFGPLVSVESPIQFLRDSGEILLVCSVLVRGEVAQDDRLDLICHSLSLHGARFSQWWNRWL